ncbi:hypothetical protein BH23PLA1_BH23PLA1_23120 [soil metagenome]
MLATWIEAPAQGRLGGAVRAGMWGAVVVGTHPVEADQEVWLEVFADDHALGPLPAYWLENKGVNSLWHVPIPPQVVGTRRRYRAAARRLGEEPVSSPQQETIIRPNLPDQTASDDAPVPGSEGLVGNRMMTARVDSRGSTYDVYFPTVGLHSDVRPAEGDLPSSRSHFRAIVAGLAAGRRLDWFAERLPWESFQSYQGATNLLVTELKWRKGPIRVLTTDFVVLGPDLPRTAGGTESPGQYIKRFRIQNQGTETRRATFGVFIHAEVNCGIGDPGLSWHDGDRALLAMNRGHGHANRKLARDATVEFALALDDRGPVSCEPTGRNEAILLRPLDLPPGATVHVDLLISGAFTGWRGDQGTYDYWLRPALSWFRAADLDRIEHATASAWDAFVDPLPEPSFPRPTYSVALRRSALAAALHCDTKWGAVASGFDRGLNASCWPREALHTGHTLDRLGHPEVGRGVFEWLERVRGQTRVHPYWVQKYTIDGWPEWETPSIDQSALIPWALERHCQRIGDLGPAEEHWRLVERAVSACSGQGGHPGLRWLDDLSLVHSAGHWDSRFGAFLYGNACVVAGLRAAARLARRLGRAEDEADRWQALADRIWEVGILQEPSDSGPGPGLIDPDSGRFLEARRLSALRSLWTDRPELLVDRVAALDIGALGLATPLDLLPAADARLRRTAEAILEHNASRADSNALTRWAPDPACADSNLAPGETHRDDLSSQATLWMARYLIRLGQETGDGRQWARALSFLDGMLARLCPLGVSLRPGPRRTDQPDGPVRWFQGVSGLHAMLIDTMLDLAGLDHDALENRLTLRPALPPNWPRIGLTQSLPVGHVRYDLRRTLEGSSYLLQLETRLDRPTRLQVDLTCPGLRELGPWRGSPEGITPDFDRSIGRLQWSLELPAGTTAADWRWGPDNQRLGSGV